MRTSQKVMLGALVVVVVGIAAAVTGMRSVVNDVLAGESGSGEFGLQPLDLDLSDELTGFDRLLIRTAWDVRIEQGDEWSVEISVPEDLEPNLNVGVNEGRLVLDITRENAGFRFGREGEGRRAVITMPELRGIEIQGFANVAIASFTGDDLEIETAGAVNVEAVEGRFDNLDVRMAGAGNLGFRGVAVTNARVDLSGATNVELRMDGGELTGSIAGFGNVDYIGTVSREAVNTAGFSRVGRFGR